MKAAPAGATGADTGPSDLPVDDRALLQAGDRTLLIVEDDPTFAGILLDVAHEKGFMGLIAARGDQALSLAQTYRPMAITLDLTLPDTNGWAVLDALKHDPLTRHIPVHIVSGQEPSLIGRKLGAVAHTTKTGNPQELEGVFSSIDAFLARRVKSVLIVEDDEVQRRHIEELIGDDGVQTTAVNTGAEALDALAGASFDCLVLDLHLPDMTGFELMTTLQETPAYRAIPIIVYTAQELTRAQETELRRAAKSIIVKDVRSPERLLDEVTLFLHRVEANLSEDKRQALNAARQQEPQLHGRKILIVDDDIRNIFALTAVLERHQMDIITAENGREAISQLEHHPDTDLVLMDVMMPEMDGYETTRLIRQNPRFAQLPIISLTAKAMPGDREQSIESGASDYISKPVNTGQLLALLRVWLSR